ncbi:Deleted in malignant brain tumors 1 protein [Liparis tanakae]|uniref:Deleted in malignant brain tumors 1 protein n=1 Tax=Liparis tanakae TaxID=230148 RepID=A0A4Z2HBU4_9TELE|nr:Deleted in malignant brain tumors 1 protein [Liparis tanakae]
MYCNVNLCLAARPSCRDNCGGNMGSCSCSGSCEYNGNCCHDYYCKCQVKQIHRVDSFCRRSQSVKSLMACLRVGDHEQPMDHNPSCLRGVHHEQPMDHNPSPMPSHNFDARPSPNHPNQYSNNAYCVWQLRAAYDQRIFLSFTYLQLENCCSCDYIAVYDGPSLSSRYLGKVCHGSLSTFSSTSNYLTVLFRTDSSVVGRGFNADFVSSLQPSSGKVDCSSDNMNITIQRSYLNSIGYDGESLYLNDPRCRPQVSSYQVVFNFPVNACGTALKFENGSAVYTNSLRASTSNYGDITRQSHLHMSVGCRMDQDSVAQIMYIVRHHDNSRITGTGRFNTSMDFFTSSSFYSKVTQVPYEVDLNQNLYVQVDLSAGDSSLVLFLDTCVTSPSANDFQSRPYYLVRNGCSVDNTYRSYVTGTRTYGRFTFKAFQFLRATESVYIQCKVLICQASDSNSRCRRGCRKRAARALGSVHDSHTLVLGPIQLKDVALERVLVAVAAHVDGVEDVVGEVDVTVLAVMQRVGVLERDGQARGTGLAVEDTRGAGAPAVLAAGFPSRAAVAVKRSAGLGADRGRGGGGVDRAGGRGHGGLLEEEGLLVHDGLCSRGHRRASLVLGLGREAGQLARQGGQLVQRVVHNQIVVVLPVLHRVTLSVVGLLTQVGQLVREVVDIFRLVRHHGRGGEVDEESTAVAQRAGLLLQDAQHLLVGKRASAFHGQQFVAAAAVVRQVAAIAAAEGAQLAFVRLLARVGSHVGLEVALVGRGEGAEVATELTCHMTVAISELHLVTWRQLVLLLDAADGARDHVDMLGLLAQLTLACRVESIFVNSNAGDRKHSGLSLELQKLLPLPAVAPSLALLQASCLQLYIHLKNHPCSQAFTPTVSSLKGAVSPPFCTTMFRPTDSF